MKRTRGSLWWWALALAVAVVPAAAQRRPYIGFVYPAGGRQGTTFEVRLGGQDVGDVHGVLISGTGVTAKVINYQRRLNPQETALLAEQLKELKESLPKPPAPAKTKPPAQPPKQAPAKPKSPGQAPPVAPGAAKPPASAVPPKAPVATALAGKAPQAPAPAAAKPAMPQAVVATPAKPPVGPPAKQADPQALALIAAIEKRLAEVVPQPAVQSVANLIYLQVTVAADAPPGDRELRLVATQGISNPLVFQVGQLAEHRRKPMLTSQLQVLGKEELAKRKRPADEVEHRVELPCTLNGQVASGEVNRYRFTAKQGQKLVFTTSARRLVPYIADAVPGWFQPILRLCDAAGREVAYVDDFRCSPDPTIFYQVPKEGEYVLSIYDGIFRGREDFVYRIQAGEIPFVTHVFPLGGQAGGPLSVAVKGWNLGVGEVLLPPDRSTPGLRALTVCRGPLVSNSFNVAVDPLPACREKEPNDGRPAVQKLGLPVIVDGRIGAPGDWDVFEFTGRAGDKVVAEVMARRLGAPTDAVVKVTDAAGKVLEFNDDSEDLGSGVNTHHADSYVRLALPADGVYQVAVGEAAGNGGDEYGYRLRISAPQPDFELRLVPSSLAIRGKSTNRVTVHAIRKDGFRDSIKLGLKDPPAGFSAAPVWLPPHLDSVSFNVKADLADTALKAVDLAIEGRATVQGKELVHPAVPAEDRMQAFLWRHLVPAGDFKVLVFDQAYKLPRKRPLPKPADNK